MVRISFPLAVFCGLLLPPPCAAAGGDAGPQTFDLSARETLTVVRMNHGDVLRFGLRNGGRRTFELEDTPARIVERIGGGIVYSFECRLRADGQPVTLRRFVCSQETFYEPWVINGVRIWFSSSAAIFDLVPIRYPERHDTLDEVDAVLAVQDAALPICPQPMKPWFPIERHFIDVGRCYNGDDPWLGPYLGQACHVGLDINMPKGTPLYAPIDFDDHWIFSGGHRWRGVRRWPDGDIWGLQSHHVDRLLVRESSPVKAGDHYAEAAGKGVGSHPHSHFEFRVGRGVLNRGWLGGTEIDPWILFWQIFETDKAARGEIRADIAPLAPAAAGKPVRFSAKGSRPGKGAGPLRYFWTFGDGGFANAPSPEYTFLRPGVYPVTLVVDDGQRQSTRTQHLTVGGETVAAPALVLEAAQEPTFRKRPVAAADVYGRPVRDVPHSLRFSARPRGPMSTAKTVRLRNTGRGELAAAEPPQVSYCENATGWLQVTTEGTGDRQTLRVAADPSRLEAGRYEAIVSVQCPGAVNPRQAFRVALNVRPSPDAEQIVVDDKDPGFYGTPFVWVGHQFLRTRRKGYQRRYLTNGGVADADALVRFTPDLAAGRYEVLFHPQTPFVESSFRVRVRHADGEKEIRFAPKQSRMLSLGVFEFDEGTDGFVEIPARGSEGLVVVDAVIFRRTEPGHGTR